MLSLGNRRAARVVSPIVVGALLLASGRAHAIPPPILAPAPPVSPTPAAAPTPATVAFPSVTATIRVLELTARAEPRRDAAVLHTFAEGESLCVSRDEVDGFRRVVLRDGAVAFVASGGLAFGPDGERRSPSVVRPLILPEAPAAEGLAARSAVTRVRDLDELARIVHADGDTSGLVRTLERRDLAASILVAAGLSVGAVIMLVALTPESDHPSRPLFVGGAAVGLGLPLIGWGISPGRGDLRRVIDVWNARHADQPLELE